MEKKNAKIIKKPREIFPPVPINRTEPVFTSGVISRLLDIPVWVLKQLDREKLVSPDRKKSKVRLYSQEELNKLSHIWYLMKERKVKVDGVKVILEMEETMYTHGFSAPGMVGYSSGRSITIVSRKSEGKNLKKSKQQ
ncbi:MAG: MerR family transcriptional regulator [Planctomycetes bacterium]|nr:MerR family transcriptional regulator [Planctomycetota bacterium]